MDPRLRWQQVVAPNLSAASAALARSNDAFNSGFSTASGVLSQYDTGQKEKADSELLAELAGLGNEQEFDKFVDNGGLNGRNISSAMRDHVLGARTGFVKDAGTRANTQGTLARTAIAQAAEGRNASEFAFNDGRRRELAGLSGLVVGANQEGNQFGRAIQEGVPENYFDAVIGSESGGDPNAKNPLSSATGLAQFTTGTWNRMRENYPELGLTADGRTDPTQARTALAAFTRENAASLRSAGINVDGGSLYAAHFLGAGGARSVLTQPDNAKLTDILPSEVIKANPFLRGMDVARFRQWSAEKGGANPNAPSARPQFDRLQQALGNSNFLSPQDVMGLIAGGHQAQEIGQNRIDATNNALTQQVSDSAVLGAFSDPNVIASDPSSILAAAQDAGLSDGDTLDLMGRLQGAVQSNPGIFNPQAPTDPLIAAAQEAQAEEDRRRDLITQRQQTDIRTISEDPVGSLKSLTGLNDGSVGQGSFSDREIQARADEIADKHNITRGEAVYAMSQAFVRDPGQFIPGWDLTRNNLSNHFPDEAIDEIVANSLGPDARSRAGDAKAISVRNSAERDNSNNALQELESEALRFEVAGREVPANLRREINSLRNTLRTGSSPQQVENQLQTYIARTGMANRLQGLEPDSVEFVRAVADLENAIRGDNSLPEEEKRLLLSAIRG